ncbi:copper ABC transporter NosDFY, putative permease protein NosY [Malaciobacter marinus]|uniref:ABC transporter permease n=1 Tax=Malaciobacter marinus TaxID=505249 RepID=A0A347TMQ3_9BACT|nr:ABC transporter permease subunit [Malaciobacter marinus]AXX87881.1 copper ABC transporter NosDFY, putative permease protein NosY [Malaciobacter marinus]PHO15414.1 ABC transporter permease [Malaciobacter marinus]
MNNLYLVFKMDIKESFRSKWFLLYTIIFGGIVALFFISGVTESKVQGFSGLSRLLLIFIEICIVIVPIFILVNTVRTIAADRDSNILEYLLSFPISLKTYFFGKFFGKLFTITIPIFAALFLALIWSTFKGVEIPWKIFIYYIFLLFSINISFLGLSFFISSLVKTQEIALALAFFVWILLLSLIDILLISILVKTTASAELIYSIALINPLQVFRIGAIALFDPQLSVIGPASYFIIDEFGAKFLLIYCVLYPILLGALFSFLGYKVFKRKDLV